MKKVYVIIVLLFFSDGFSQSIKDYTGVVIPLKYDFQKEQNQYRIQTLIKVNLLKSGFQAYYSNEIIPPEINDRCKLLTLDLIKESTFIMTKLTLVFKDCYGVAILKSGIGKSREKQFEIAYKEALDNAFMSLNSSANSTDNSNSVLQNKPSELILQTPTITAIETEAVIENKTASLLYAQPTSFGYQLIDSEPKVILKIYKTSNPASYIAFKGNLQGVLVAKENQWLFEYYQNDNLVSEKVDVKF